jgi:hypothetical protein
MKRTTTLASLLMLCLCFLWACNHRGEKKSISVPESGEFCYKADSGQEYIQIRIDQGKVEGKLLNTAANEILIKSFSGHIVAGNEQGTPATLQVDVSYADGSDEQTWLLWFEENGLRIKYDAGAMELTHYASIPNKEFATLFESLNETILTYKSTGFRLPKGKPLCYQAIRTASGSYLLEYFQLWNTDGKIKGRGAGYYAGEPAWDFDFHGKQVKNTMKLTINYRKHGEEQHSVLETWTIDPKDQRIYIKSYPHSVLAKPEYVKADNEDFLNFVNSYFTKEDRVR